MIKPITSSNITPTIKQTTQKLLPKIAEPSSKKASEQDILIFRQYVFSKDFQLKTSESEIKDIFKLEGEEFFNATFEFLFKKLCPYQELKPQVVEVSMDPSIAMAYDFTSNLLIKNPNAPETTKLEKYSHIRHELQHMLQNFEIYRHRELGEKAIEFHATQLANAQIKIIDNTARNISIEEIEAIVLSQEALDVYKKLKVPLSNNNEQEYVNLLASLKEELVEENRINATNFRNLIINKMGTLKEGSRAERRAEKFFNGMTNFNQDVISGKIHAGKYSYDVRENEAYIAQDVAMSEVERHFSDKKVCYINHVRQLGKKIVDTLKNDSKMAEEFNETTQEIREKQLFSSIKELADYLFD